MEVHLLTRLPSTDTQALQCRSRSRIDVLVEQLYCWRCPDLQLVVSRRRPWCSPVYPSIADDPVCLTLRERQHPVASNLQSRR